MMSKIFPTDPPDTTNRIHEYGAGNYWFYHKGSYPNQEPLLYQHIINNANSDIEIWDPYFNVNGNNSDHDIFNNIPNNITLKILTQKGLNGTQSYLTDVHNSLKMKITSSKNIRFGLRVFNKGDISNQGDWFFHDRYLIIDKTDIYLVGSSVGYHLKPEKSTGIFKVNNVDTGLFIISLFEEYWKQAYRHKIPLQFLHL